MVRLERQDPFPDWESARWVESQSEKKYNKELKFILSFGLVSVYKDVFMDT